MESEYQRKLKEAAIDLASELKSNFKDITGISISGSLASGSADEFSDIDLDIWLSEGNYRKWIAECPLIEYLKQYNPNRETPTNISFIIGNSHKFDITLLSIDLVAKEEWKIEQKSDRKNSVILFDENGTVRNLLNQKIRISPEAFNTKEKYSVTNPSTDYYKFYISAYLKYHVPVALARKRFEQAHFLLNQSIHFILNLLWLEKEKFYPYDKSKWILIDKYLTNDQKNLLKEAQLIKDHNEEDVRRRRESLRNLYSSLGYKEKKFYHDKLDLR